MKTIRLLAILEASTVTGPAKNLLQFAQIANSKRFDPPVEVSIANFRREGDSDVLLKAAAQAGIPFYPITEQGRFDRSVIPSLISLAGKIAPNVIQSHAVKSHFLIRRAGLDRQFPWVAFHHGYTWPDLRTQVYNQLDRWSLRAAPRVVTVSCAFRDQLSRMGVPSERIAVVHNAIDPNWGNSARLSAARLRAELAIPSGSRVILIVGRLSREKDHLTLLDAISEIRRAGTISPHLVIVGEGPERAPIISRIRALDLTARVTLTGQTPSAEPYYGIADVAVLSSRSEGSPNALLEAMAARIPVVATTVGGIPEIVANGDSALLVPAGDAGSLERAIATVLSDRALAERLAFRARQLVEANFSPESRVRALCAIYGSLVV